MPLPGLGGSLRPERPERPTSSNVAQTPSPKMAADSGNRPASMNAAGTSPKGASKISLGPDLIDIMLLPFPWLLILFGCFLVIIIVQP